MTRSRTELGGEELPGTGTDTSLASRLRVRDIAAAVSGGGSLRIGWVRQC